MEKNERLNSESRTRINYKSTAKGFVYPDVSIEMFGDDWNLCLNESRLLLKGALLVADELSKKDVKE